MRHLQSCMRYHNVWACHILWAPFSHFMSYLTSNTLLVFTVSVHFLMYIIATQSFFSPSVFIYRLYYMFVHLYVSYIPPLASFLVQSANNDKINSMTTTRTTTSCQTTTISEGDQEVTVTTTKATPLWQQSTNNYDKNNNKKNSNNNNQQQ